MRPFISATKQFFNQIWSDVMLAVLILVPLIMGLAFRFAVPVMESYLCNLTGRVEILTSYYPIFDMLLSAMTTVMFSAAGALVILDEADSGISRVYITSPVGRSGYLLSRIGVPTIIATLYCIIVTLVFQLSSQSLGRIILLALCSGALSLAVSLMIPSMAKNRVEGMAISKLSGLIMLGLPAELLLPSPIKYISGILPSFWMTEFVMGGSILCVLLAIISSALITAIFMHQFNKRVL